MPKAGMQKGGKSMGATIPPADSNYYPLKMKEGNFRG